MQVKGWKNCNVYCCTIFSNKRTQNLFVHFYVNTPWWVFFFLFHFLVLVREFLKHFPVQPFSFTPPFFFFFSFSPFTNLYWFLQHLYLHYQPVFGIIVFSPSVSVWLLCQPNMDTNLGGYFGFHKCGEILTEAEQLHDFAPEQTKHFPVFVTIL